MRHFLAALLALSVSSADAAETVTGPATIIDGDTIDVDGRRVRLFGIDAPEGKQQCQRAGRPWNAGQDAKAALSRIIGSNTVTCAEADKADRYNRMIGRCEARGVDVGQEMVRQGWARAFVRYSRKYEDQERSAERHKRGIWSGDCEAPWDWRRHH